MRMPDKMNKGTATMIKLFIELNIDCVIKFKGISVYANRTTTEEIPIATASGIPKTIIPRKSASSARLILLSTFQKVRMQN